MYTMSSIVLTQAKDGGEALKNEWKSQLHFKWSERSITTHDIKTNSGSYRGIHA